MRRRIARARVRVRRAVGIDEARDAGVTAGVANARSRTVRGRLAVAARRRRRRLLVFGDKRGRTCGLAVGRGGCIRPTRARWPVRWQRSRNGRQNSAAQAREVARADGGGRITCSRFRCSSRRHRGRRTRRRSRSAAASCNPTSRSPRRRPCSRSPGSPEMPTSHNSSTARRRSPMRHLGMRRLGRRDSRQHRCAIRASSLVVFSTRSGSSASLLPRSSGHMDLDHPLIGTRSSNKANGSKPWFVALQCTL